MTLHKHAPCPNHPGCPVSSRICLRIHTALPRCQPSALKHSPEPTKLLQFNLGMDPALSCSHKGAFGRKQLFSSHPHISPGQTGAAFGGGTHLIDGDGGSVGQVHLWSLFHPPQGRKEQRCSTGPEDSAAPQPTGLKEPVAGKVGQQEETAVVQRERSTAGV